MFNTNVSKREAKEYVDMLIDVEMLFFNWSDDSIRARARFPTRDQSLLGLFFLTNIHFCFFFPSVSYFHGTHVSYKYIHAH